MSWRLLSPAMQRAVFDLGWPRLWPMQDEAIAAILGGEAHVLLLGDTASGKTEGAFLPILSLPAGEVGFSVLYVSPLRALLNDQFERLRALAAYAGRPVHLWHSDVTRTRKRGTSEAPSGLLLTTPESLEAMCIHRPQYLRAFFAGLRFVVVDEVHAFLGTGRGVQLRSLLRRLEVYCDAAPRRVGLSATVGDPPAAAAFLGEPCTVCAAPGPRKGTRLHLRHVPDGDLLSDLRAATAGRKSLIFCNSRGRVEWLTYALERTTGESGAHLPHHGSLHLRERAHAESALRAAAAGAIICTSTLELGIDVGGVDLVVQVDCTAAVASLRQRLGRSGRQPGQDRIGQLYTTSEPQLLAAVAVVELMRGGWVEPPPAAGPAFDVVWHQAISTAVERGAVDPATLPPGLAEHMLAEGHLERRGGAVGPGPRGLDLASRPDFCAVFQADEAYEVACGARLLGRLPPLPIYRPGVPLILAGKVWTIAEVDHRRRRTEVVPGASAAPPVFTSAGLAVHDRVRQAMAEVLCSDAAYPYLDRAGAEVLHGLRAQYRSLGLGPTERPALVDIEWSEFHAFAGDRSANALALLLQMESGLRWEVTAYGGLTSPAAWEPLADTLERYGREPVDAGELERRLLDLVPDDALLLPKFGRFLPLSMRRACHAATQLDVPGALALLRARISDPPRRNPRA